MKPVIEQLIERQLAPLRNEIDRVWQVIDGQAKEAAALERGIAATDYLVRQQISPTPDALPPHSPGALQDPAFDALRSWKGSRRITDRESQLFREGFIRGELGQKARAEKAETDCMAQKQFAERALADVAALRAEVERRIGSGAQLLADNGRLRAEVERLRAESVTAHAANDDLVSRHIESQRNGATVAIALRAAESRLAAATELLRRTAHVWMPNGLSADVRAFLAGQPAAPARTDCGHPGDKRQGHCFECVTAAEAEACQRTYPLDPLTAEDPCEDCGRDQRKHEITPFELVPDYPF